MAVGDFSFRHFAISAAALPARTFVIGGNSNRISLIVANPNGPIVQIFNGGGTVLAGVLAVVTGGSTLVLTYQDWGEIMQQEIWLGLSGGPATVYAVELFRLPRE